MKQNQIFETSREKNKNIKKSKSFCQDCNLNQVLIEKIKKLKNEKGDKSFLLDFIKLNERITTQSHKSPEISKNNVSRINSFNKFNFSNLNNIRKIYLKNNNYFSTEIDHKFSNKNFNNFQKEQNDNNENIKNNKYKNNNIRKDFAPIYEIYIPSKMKKARNIYNNYINMAAKQEYIKHRAYSPNEYIRFSTNKDIKEYSNLQKYINYYPYIEKIKKIRASNSNDKIFMNRKFINPNNYKKISLNNSFNFLNRNNTSNIFSSPFSITSRNILSQEEENYNQPQKCIIMDIIKERKHKTTHYRPREYNKEIELKKIFDNKLHHHKQLSIRKCFGDNYKYFERNESPVKIDKTFHNRRSPAKVFGYENYFIIDDSNDRLIATSYDCKNFRRLNSEGNVRIKENNIFPVYKNY